MNFKEILKNINFCLINNKKIENKVRLIRNSNYNYVSVKFSPILIISKNKKDIKLMSGKVKKFLSVLDSKCENFDETLFVKNFKKTFFNIKDIKNEDFFGINGSVKFNGKINLSLESFQASEHELLHLASVNFDNFNNLLLFLNEGYTQILTERYFEPETKYAIYPFETLILRQIEFILGKEFMETQYFKGNSNNFVLELHKYTNSKNVEYLISNMQKIEKIGKNDKYGIFENKDELQSLLNEIFYVLFDCIKTKINGISDFEEKVLYFLSNKEFNNQLTFYDDFGNKVTYEIYNHDSLWEFYNKLTSNIKK